MCYIVCHSNLVYVYVNYISHGKNKGPMSYNKDHGPSYLRNIYFMNMWKKAIDGICWCKKIKEMEINKKHQKKEEYPSFSNQ
jgi:hypothetical protein